MEISTFMESNGILEWFMENGLDINVNKTTLFDFSITPKEYIDLNIWVNDTEICS